MGGAETHAVARVLATNHRAPPVSVAQVERPVATITDHSEAKRMRVVSWNVNGIRACVRHGLVDFMDRSGADIVGV